MTDGRIVPAAAHTVRCVAFLLALGLLAALPRPAAAICPGATLLANHDGSFENAYSWGFYLAAPDFGSFAEGYTATGQVCGMAVWLTTANGNSVPVPDLYIWADDGTNPGEVLAMVAGVDLGPIGFWPVVSRHTAEITAAVDGGFFVGLWPAFEDDAYYVAADLDGPGGRPRTKVPPGQDPGTGWYDVNDVWPEGARAMAIEVYLESLPTPVVSRSWGRIKRLFQDAPTAGQPAPGRRQ